MSSLFIFCVAVPFQVSLFSPPSFLCFPELNCSRSGSSANTCRACIFGRWGSHRMLFAMIPKPLQKTRASTADRKTEQKTLSNERQVQRYRHIRLLDATSADARSVADGVLVGSLRYRARGQANRGTAV